jgi:hypothetical protein
MSDLTLCVFTLISSVIHVEIFVAKLALRQVFLRVFLMPSQSLFHESFTRLQIRMVNERITTFMLGSRPSLCSSGLNEKEA